MNREFLPSAKRNTEGSGGPPAPKANAQRTAEQSNPWISFLPASGGMSWDHLLYTGNPEIGREVMAAAAVNLTPVTLELGGKCPAVITPGAVNAANVEAVIGTKIIKSGQMCVSIDYALVPRGEVDRFVDEAQAFMARAARTIPRAMSARA